MKMFLGVMAVFLGVAACFSLFFGVGCIVADRLFPAIPFIRRWIDELPLVRKERE